MVTRLYVLQTDERFAETSFNKYMLTLSVAKEWGGTGERDFGAPDGFAPMKE